jgi:hypothetical protein
MIHVLFLAATLVAPPEMAPADRESPLIVPGEEHQRRADGPRFGSFELRLSGYRPNIDAEFGGSAGPFQTAFGSGRGLMFRAHVGRAIWHKIGTLEVGFGGGYFEKYGHGITSSTHTTSADTTAFKVIPLSLSLTYRFDWVADRVGFPLVPYGRASFERYQWWVNDGAGDTAKDLSGHSGSGATNGYSFTGGLAFLLDFLDPSLARQMENDTGIQHTYLFVDVTKSFVDDFHSKTSWDLSDAQLTVAAGLMLVF